MAKVQIWLRREKALIDALQDWASDCEGMPGDPSDARLLKALWTYEGDRTKPCDECDGECGEPCAPCTVVQAHGGLDRFIETWRRDHGLPVAQPDVRQFVSNRTGA